MMWTREVHNSAQPVSMQAGQPARSLQTTLSTLFYAILESLQDRRVKCEPMWSKVSWTCTHYPLLPLLFPQPDELFVLPGDKVNGRILQQGGKHKQETHSHPDIDGLHVGHLELDKKGMRRSLIAALCSSSTQHSDPHLPLPRFIMTLWDMDSWPTTICEVTAKTWGWCPDRVIHVTAYQRTSSDGCGGTLDWAVACCPVWYNCEDYISKTDSLVVTAWLDSIPFLSFWQKIKLWMNNEISGAQKVVNVE